MCEGGGDESRHQGPARDPGALPLQDQARQQRRH